jgi:acyl-CoA synthetase (AMP-forming)/AMP-acid ligase II
MRQSEVANMQLRPNEPSVFERRLVHTPVSHFFGINNALRAWSLGETAVFASKTFDVQATLRALVHEKCTFMSAVPALVRAIIGQPNFPGKEALDLRYVTLGSTLIAEDDIRLCQQQLGATHAIQGYGLSEGAPVLSWKRSDPMLRDSGYHAELGKALPGANLRICAPGQRQALERNQVGELHIGGSSVIRGYLHGIDSSAFYADDVGNWLVPGDQATMDDDGVLHILGRYEDVIIRAGENVAPLKIETVLSQIPGVSVSHGSSNFCSRD